MKPGQFRVRLIDKAPRSMWAAVQEFDHIVIIPTRMLPAVGYSDATILAAARAGGYTGVVTSKPSNTEFAGEGLSRWLGTEDGVGDLLDTKVSNTAAALSTWVPALLPASLSVGTITDSGTGTHTYEYQWMSRREALTHMCRSVGAEWRVNADGTFDAATAANLFRTTPSTVITRKAEGPSGGFYGLQATRLVQARDVSKYTSEVVVVGKSGDGAVVATGSATAAAVYKDFLNNNVVMQRLANAPTEPAANVTAYAGDVLAMYSSVRRQVSLSSDTYAVPLRTRPGDQVFVYDQAAFLVDAANEVVWRGELTNPIKLRCHAYTWPIRKGMSVLARRSGATPVYTDLTPWVEWEKGETTWEVGGSFADPDQDPTQLNPSFLGVNPEIVSRVTPPPFIVVADSTSWESTATQPTNYTVTWEYNVAGGRCRGTMNALAGAGFTAGTGNYQFQHPLGAVLPAGRSSNLCGVGRVRDNSANQVSNDMSVLIDDSGQLTLRYTASPVAASGLGADTVVSQVAPMAFAVNDRVEASYDFPIV